MIIAEVQLTPGCYVHSTKITYFLVTKKFQQKFSHVLLHNICMFVKFCEKLIFLWWIGKDKTCLVKFLFLVVPNFIFTQAKRQVNF
jgi:hypothetical protein